MADLATLQTHRAHLEEARAEGYTRITDASGRTVTTSADDLEKRIAAVDREIRNIVESSKPTTTRAVVSRG